MASREDISFEACFLSAPTSPRRQSIDSPVAFYSFPPSPAHGRNPSWESSSDPDFEFGTIVEDGSISTTNFASSAHWPSSNSNHGHRGSESLPAMAFADELFCEGKVMPLKPPPGPRNSSHNVSRSLGGAPSPRSPRIPFSRRNLWDDDFDPFVAALESVKAQPGGKENKNHRRSESLSPNRETGGSLIQIEPESTKLPVDRSGSLEKPSLGPKEANPQAQYKPIGPAPRGLRIMRFLMMRSKSMSIAGQEGKGLRKKLRSNNNNINTSSSSSSSSSSTSLAATSSRAVTKVTAQQLRPRLFICLGYGSFNTSKEMKRFA